MRINKFVALATGISRRGADSAIRHGRVEINGKTAILGMEVKSGDVVTLDGELVSAVTEKITIMLNKPAGYVVSREGQGSKTVYDLLPLKLHHLKPVGRLDKKSTGLLLLTNDGQLAYELTHPGRKKKKVYKIELNQPLDPLHEQAISNDGIPLQDGPSKLRLKKLNESRTNWQVEMHEGRNRQIRRTFATLGYTVTTLHRTQFGDYMLSTLKPGDYQQLRKNTYWPS